jgi:predicted phage baseplate assembly protein
LKNRRGFSGFVTAARGAFIPVPALEEVESAAEVALVEEVAYQEHTTCIRLRAALENVYDSFSFVIYGNVVPARQGRTVLYEVLGSGDGSQANQCFRLRQGPLSFYSAPVPSGVEAALAVQVNGVTWHPAPFLYGLEKDSRAYIVRQDARGNTEIIFGDGEHGARLPSGYEQITATYSVGIGPEGNVPAGSLNLLQSALPGIDSVTNPLRPAGGAGPESLERARQNAPLSTRTVERIVSLPDYEDFVRCFAGVGKAQARWLHTSTGDVLHITLADHEGQPVPRTSALYQMLVQAIAENRGTSEPRVCIDSFEPVYFNLRARLRVERDQRSRLRDIEAAVRKEIERSFAFDAREFGLEVSASGLRSLMQAIPGVMAVQLVHLYPSCEQAGLAQVLEAGLARWQAGSLLPAQMLLVNSAPEGIVLDLEVAE